MTGKLTVIIAALSLATSAHAGDRAEREAGARLCQADPIECARDIRETFNRMVGAFKRVSNCERVWRLPLLVMEPSPVYGG